MAEQRRKIGPIPLPRLGTMLGAAALFIAWQGTAWALPGLNTVDSGDIIDGQVASVDIGTDAVRHPDIKAGAVRQDEIGTDAVGADELKDTWIVGSGNPVNAGTAGSATATCPAGYQIVSGGWNWDLNIAGLNATSLELNTAAQSVTVLGFNDTAGSRTLSARAYCIEA